MAQEDNFQIHKPFSGYNRTFPDMNLLSDIETLGKLATKENKDKIEKALQSLGGTYEIKL